MDLLLGLKLLDAGLDCASDAIGRSLNEGVGRPPAQRQAAIASVALDPGPLLGLDVIAIGSGAGDRINVLKPRQGVEQLRRGANNVVCPHVLAVEAIEILWRPQRR